MVIGTITSSFSQTSYPKKIIWESDTVVAITKPQLIKINRSLNDYVHLRKLTQNLQMNLSISDSLCFYWKSVAEKTDSLLLMEAQKFEHLALFNKSLRGALKDKERKSRKIGIGVGVGGTLFGILMGVLLGK